MVPTIGEPTSPAKLALILMRPIATAAAESDSVSVGSTQNGDGHEKAKNPARHNQPKTSAHG